MDYSGNMDKKIECIRTALVVGGGIGGMAAAISLARQGVEVDLIDLDPDWRVYGAGITITGPTMRAYRRLGMLDDIAEQGAISRRTSIFRYDGTHLQDMDEPAMEEGLPATGGIMRPVLHNIMQQRIRALGIPVRLGLTVDRLTNREADVDVQFSDGSEQSYNLVVGADSIYSRVRDLSFPHMGEATPTGQGCWRVSIERPPEQECGEFYLGHRFAVGISLCAADRVYLWLLSPHQRRRDHFTEQELFERTRENLAEFGGNAGWVRDNLEKAEWINYRPLAARLQPRPWVNGRIVLIGDAVHATTPHLASGAGMAVESAVVLSEELARADSAEQALQAYEDRRYPRCKDVVDTSIAVGRIQLEGGDPAQVGGMISDALHRLAAPF